MKRLVLLFIAFSLFLCANQNRKLCYFDDGIVVLSIGYKIEEGNHGCLIYQSKKLINQMHEDAYNNI